MLGVYFHAGQTLCLYAFAVTKTKKQEKLEELIYQIELCHNIGPVRENWQYTYNAVCITHITV